MSTFAQIGVAALFMSISSCDQCRRYVDDFREDVVSPDGTKKAIIFRRTCQKANPMYGSVHVCLSPANQSKPADSDTVFATDGDMTVSARWIDSAHLRVIYGLAPSEDGSTVSKQTKSFRSVSIEYSNIP